MSGAAGRVAGTVDVVTAGSVEVTREGPLGTFGTFGMFGPKDCGTKACGTGHAEPGMRNQGVRNQVLPAGGDARRVASGPSGSLRPR
ncbi:hypothetical protein GCM10010317_065580 [Streptomyces mirabilis]|nr:hypothetical protein GCM10010317_065580 [Streptomyces mirabilis]